MESEHQLLLGCARVPHQGSRQVGGGGGGSWGHGVIYWCKILHHPHLVVVLTQKPVPTPSSVNMFAKGMEQDHLSSASPNQNQAAISSPKRVAPPLIMRPKTKILKTTKKKKNVFGKARQRDEPFRTQHRVARINTEWLV